MKTTLLFISIFVLAGCGPEKIENVSVTWTPYSDIAATFPAGKTNTFLFIKQSNCDHCDRMEFGVFARPEIAHFLNTNFTNVKLDILNDLPIVIQGQSYDYGSFWELLRLQEIPTYYFFDSSGKVIGLLAQETDVRTFKQLLVYVTKGHFYKTPWTEFLKTEEARLDTLIGLW